MTQFPEDIKFKYSWRNYQQRVLNELENHLDDRHLHVIAPPGSGKTVLGIEVAIRLNMPTLILAPTIAIRNQWIQRICELFLNTDITPDWISRDIHDPKFLTVITYQGLHAACNNLQIEENRNEEEEEEEDENNGKEKSVNRFFDSIVSGMKAQNIKVIVVDEAHHLKNAWWLTLTKIKEKIDSIIVGLTATPPYDVSFPEWERYIELTGPVDTEISVPELIIEGDLCPHQDYIYFTFPSKKENDILFEFRQNISNLFQEIKKDETIIQAIENQRFWKNPLEHLEWIYTNLPYYSAALIFLNFNKKEIPKSHLEIIGDKNFKIPELDYKWIEILLDLYLFKYKDLFKSYEKHQKLLETKIRVSGAIEKHQFCFSDNKRITGFLTSSISKLIGIKEIVDFEYRQLGKGLRMVILSDYIRKEFFVTSPENNLELNKIGVIPIFEKLRRENESNKKIGVLTGSLIIIPASAYSAFREETNKYTANQISFSEVQYDPNYLQINLTESIKNDIIHIITKIFESGQIEVLIGTKSLLGEGWDAPAINSLILASFVGSFVLSNQMRGRAIRTQNENPGKTGNIWHLVTIDPTSQNGGEDFELMKRRFRSFLGVSFNEEPAIENGAGRLNLPKGPYYKETAVVANNEMFAFAADREFLKKRWEIALNKGITLVEEIKIPFSDTKNYSSIKSMYLKKTIANFATTLVSGLIGFGLENIIILGRIAKHIKSVTDLYFYLMIIGIGGIVLFGRQTLKTLALYLKYRDISKDFSMIGEALLSTLIKAETIRTNRSKLKIQTTMDSTGAIFCHLEGGSTFEKSTFINSFKEIIETINNPRYIILRKSLFILFIKQKDYHSVPEIIGKNKILAEYFRTQWEYYVGGCELIYTRTLQGRKLILKSRLKSLAAQFESEIEHINKWK